MPLLRALRRRSHTIANLRATSERTVRQRAKDVYRKAGLSGRAELSAFFLEDLLLSSNHTDEERLCRMRGQGLAIL